MLLQVKCQSFEEKRYLPPEPWWPVLEVLDVPGDVLQQELGTVISGLWSLQQKAD